MSTYSSLTWVLTAKMQRRLDIIFYIHSKAPARITLREIAHNLGMSMSYVECLILPMSSAGIVKGYRGAKGGYTLSKYLSSLTVGDIFRALGKEPDSPSPLWLTIADLNLDTIWDTYLYQEILHDH